MFALVNLINYLYQFRGYETDKFRNVPNDIQICNLGSSHGKDFDYSDFKDKYTCFNFSLDGQHLMGDYTVLNYYRNNIKSGAIVFIIVSYQHLFSQGQLVMDERYYRFLPRELIRDYDEKINFYTNYFPALAVTDCVVLFERIFGVNFVTASPYEEMNPENSKKMAARRFINLMKYRIAKNDDGKRSRQDKYLYDIINLCKKIGAKPILVTTPYLKEFSEEIKQNDNEFHKDFYEILDEVVHTTDVKYYDYSNDDRFCSNYDLFVDVDHLNHKGARKFTNILMREVLNISE